MSALYEPQVDEVGQGHYRFYGYGPPAAASDVVGRVPQPGDFIWNVTPTLGGVLGWLCVTAGTTAIPQGVWIEIEGYQGVTMTLTAAQVLAMNGAPITLIAAQGAGTIIEVISAVLENVYGSVYTGGGTIGLFYGSNTGPLAAQTVPSTFLTVPTVNQIMSINGALTSAAASAVENTAVVLSNTTAAFAAGTGGSLIIKVKYRTHINLS